MTADYFSGPPIRRQTEIQKAFTGADTGNFIRTVNTSAVISLASMYITTIDGN
jgi:hypothetical protein